MKMFRPLAVVLLSLLTVFNTVAPSYAGSAGAAAVATGGPTLLNYTHYLVAHTQQLSGVTLNIFSGTPFDAINVGSGAPGSSTAGWAGTGINVPQVGAPSYTPPGSSTGLTPAIINTFVVAPLSACGASPFFYNTCNNSPPNDWSSQGVAAQAANRLVDVVLIMANPAGSGNNPFTTGGGVLNGGSSTQNQLFANLNTVIPSLKLHTKPFIISMQGELNLTGGYTDPQCWFATGAATSLQAGLVFQLVANYLVSQGVRNALFAFETNAGVGNYLFGYPGAQIQGGGWSGPGAADLIFLDGSPMYFDGAAYTAMQSTGLPMAYGSAVPAMATQNGINLYTGAGMPGSGVGLQTIGADYTQFFAYILWSQYNGGGTQGTALNFQLGAVQAMSTAPFTSTIQPGIFVRAKYHAEPPLELDLGVGLIPANDDWYALRAHAR